ncbi:MAG: Rne/Rng family ribonuclease, partial [Gammaproteobacteria bacterium]|nr:Rne/Rng family ribonuclease [Gammaproteobacteria bacterium]
PNSTHVGVSQRIEASEERQRLREVVSRCSDLHLPGGFIVRTVAEGISDAALEKDVLFLRRLWAEFEQRMRDNSAGIQLLHEDLSLPLRTVRDLANEEVERIRIDSRTVYDQVQHFVEKFIPELTGHVDLYTGEPPIFDIYAIEEEIQKALKRKVVLKSGGYLIIDQTEAMTTIDVNTGGFVGHRNLEETIFKTNLEATQAIARQLRLRNLGGIIIIDLIDMADEEHQRMVERSLERALERDHAKTQICRVSQLGLIQMTRKRTRESLEHILCETCPTCNGRGTVKSPETVCFEIYRELVREARAFASEQMLVLAAAQVVDLMLDEQSTAVAELEEFLGCSIRFQVESLYTQEQFDIVLM